jgi:uncharacterized protein (TIGR02145 family)
MKKRILVLSTFALALSANLLAQVSIGDLSAPAKGALLDLNKAVKGGLTLSNVKLDNLYTIPPTFPGMSSPPADVNTKFTGAMVYHTGENNIPVGIYVWNGANWTPAGENCKPLTSLTLKASAVLAKTGDAVTFSVSSDASERCAEGETYTWSVTPTTATVSNPSPATAAIRFTAANVYTVKVTAKNRYGDYTSLPETSSNEVVVIVTADGSLPVARLNNIYGIVGKACLDVKKSKQPATQSTDAYNARNNDFSGNSYAKTYEFVHGDAYSNLTVTCIDDPANIVSAITSPAISATGNNTQSFTVAFKPDVKDLVPENGDSLTVKLIASYKDSNNTPRLAYLEIRVEDGTCVCPAKVSATQWLNFMCHNLGAAYDIISPSQMLTYQHHGDWYQWGAKTASLVNTGTNNGDQIWDSNDCQESSEDDTSQKDADGNNLWKAENNPCPAGWRIPSNAEWGSVINTSNNSWANVPDPWGAVGNTQFGNLKKFGDYLFLPAVGDRYPTTYYLQSRGSYGSYWCSGAYSTTQGRYMRFQMGNTGNGIPHLYYTNRQSGFSVRCVSAE